MGALGALLLCGIKFILGGTNGIDDNYVVFVALGGDSNRGFTTI